MRGIKKRLTELERASGPNGPECLVVTRNESGIVLSNEPRTRSSAIETIKRLREKPPKVKRLLLVPVGLKLWPSDLQKYQEITDCIVEAHLMSKFDITPADLREN
jgi:hypothetical protein